jgi:hypothetical protein
MPWEFKVNQDGCAIDDVLLRVTVEGWGQVRTLARMVGVVANTPDPVLGYKPPRMTADVLDVEGNEIVSLGGLNSWEVPDDAPVSQSRPRVRM